MAENNPVAGYASANNKPMQLDALIVGGGFGGVYQLKRLQERGFDVKLIESGSDFGGVWYWNRYPGARVDSPIPHYEYSDPGLWRDWQWKQRFPGSAELREYFKFVADKWDIRKNAIFDTHVESAIWNQEHALWIVTAWNSSGSQTRTFHAKFFLPNSGFAAKRYTPEWAGIETFRGTWVHPSYWPQEEPNLKGKRVAVIGTGSTGVQLVQALAFDASEFVLFQRTPNLALPMKQVNYDGKLQALPKENYEALYKERLQSFGGFDYNFMPEATFDHDPDQRREVYQRLWDEGDFHFWLATYHDMLFSEDANTEAYNFWRDKVRPRLTDARLKDKLAPLQKPHAYGCKRVSLENGYYEIFNLPHVHLVDVNETPVVEVTPNGIRTTEKEWLFDYVVCATGYDAITGGILDMNVEGKDGRKLRNYWKEGIKTNMGISVPGFPNMFFTYGPQAPTALCNGPTCAEIQGDWIVDALCYLRARNLRSINAEEASAEAWAKAVWTHANASLLPTAKSWYMGDNIPGKTREPLIYLGGVPQYYKILHNAAGNEYAGFQLG